MLLTADCPICNKHYETKSDEIITLGMVPIIEELHAPEYRKKLNSIDYKTTNITAKMIKEFRELTGSGVMDIKKALIMCEGNFRKAYDLLSETNCFGKYVIS